MISRVLNYIFPSECPSCGSPTDNMSFAPFCSDCWAGMRRYDGPSCRICATPFSSGHAHVCSDCLKEPPLFSKAMSFGVYEGTLSEAINFYKFHGIKRLSGPLGRLLLGFDADGADAVVPVPLSIRGLRERGFNQSLLIAKTFSKDKSIPLIMDGLIKQKETQPQIGLSARERAKNLKGSFSATRDFKGMRLILIDDVMTTGATANECCRQLISAGAVDIRVLTLARAGDR